MWEDCIRNLPLILKQISELGILKFKVYYIVCLRLFVHDSDVDDKPRNTDDYKKGKGDF